MVFDVLRSATVSPSGRNSFIRIIFTRFFFNCMNRKKLVFIMYTVVRKRDKMKILMFKVASSLKSQR